MLLDLQKTSNITTFQPEMKSEKFLKEMSQIHSIKL